MTMDKPKIRNKELLLHWRSRARLAEDIIQDALVEIELVSEVPAIGEWRTYSELCYIRDELQAEADGQLTRQEVERIREYTGFTRSQTLKYWRTRALLGESVVGHLLDRRIQEQRGQSLQNGITDSRYTVDWLKCQQGENEPASQEATRHEKERIQDIEARISDEGNAQQVPPDSNGVLESSQIAMTGSRKTIPKGETLEYWRERAELTECLIQDFLSWANPEDANGYLRSHAGERYTELRHRQLASAHPASPDATKRERERLQAIDTQLYGDYRVQEKLSKLVDDDSIVDDVASNCRDQYHDDRWCPTCEAREAGIVDYRDSILRLFRKMTNQGKHEPENWVRVPDSTADSDAAPLTMYNRDKAPVEAEESWREACNKVDQALGVLYHSGDVYPDYCPHTLDRTVQRAISILTEARSRICQACADDPNQP